jgi:MFS family permease
MTSPPDLLDPPVQQPRLRAGATAARRAVFVIFALNGFAFASWAVRIPDISHRVGASHAVLGVALLCVSLGALATMRSTGAVCERWGSGLVCVVSATLLSLSLALPGLVDTRVALCLALAVVGAAGGMLNVAMNSLGVALEKRAGTPLLSRAHAALSFGGLAGGLVGGLAAARIDAAAHLTAVGVTGLLVTSILARRLLAVDEPRGAVSGALPQRRPGSAATTRAVLVLGAVSGCAAYGEGALSDWTTLHLSEDLGAPATAAAAGYAIFCLAMGSGRLAGHWLLQRLGATRLTVSGSLVAALGMLLVALAPSMGVALTGLLMVGLGFSNIFPVAIARAGALAGPRGVGLASTLGYGGLLLGPATIGFLASMAGLPLALTTVSVLAVVASGLAVWVRDDAPAALAWLPSQTETWVRLTTGMVPTATGLLHAAANRHASSLSALDTSQLERDGAWPPLRGDHDFRDLGTLLGAGRPATEPYVGTA